MKQATAAKKDSVMESSLIEITQSIINFFYSPWTKGICCILLIGEAIGLWLGVSNNRGGDSRSLFQ